MAPKIICLIILCLANSGTCTISVLLKEFNYVIEKFEAEPSDFGNPLPKGGLDGLVVYADPADSCNSINKRPELPDYKEKWILLVARSFDCLFEDKVRMAQNAGYDGVIIHNKDSDDLITMTATNPHGIFIPSVFVTETDGIIIKNRYCNSRYFININDEVPIGSNRLLRFGMLLAVVGLFLTIAIDAAYYLYVYCNQLEHKYTKRGYLVFSTENNSIV